jgi:DNA-binding PadR family transcriptional regulator
MPKEKGLGEFERRMLLTILELGNGVFAVDLSRTLERTTGRRVSRGALYATLDRLEGKRLVQWKTEETTSGRGGLPRRAFTVTPAGVAALRASHQELTELVRSMDAVLGRL